MTQACILTSKESIKNQAHISPPIALPTCSNSTTFLQASYASHRRSTYSISTRTNITRFDAAAYLRHEIRNTLFLYLHVKCDVTCRSLRIRCRNQHLILCNTRSLFSVLTRLAGFVSCSKSPPLFRTSLRFRFRRLASGSGRETLRIQVLPSA